MTTILITILPHWARLIRTGKKHCEIRKCLPQKIEQKVGEKGEFRVLMCESQSGGNITGEFICDGWEWFNPADVREETIPGRQLLKDSCLSAPELYDYGKEHLALCSWHISDAIDYCSTKGYHPHNISEFGIKRPPQGLRYVDEEVYFKVIGGKSK